MKRWNIVIIDDLAEGQETLRNQSGVNYIEDLYNENICPEWMYSDENDSINKSKKYLDIYGNKVKKRSGFPLHIMLGSFPEMWTISDQIAKYSEIIIIDFLLDYTDPNSSEPRKEIPEKVYNRTKEIIDKEINKYLNEKIGESHFLNQITVEKVLEDGGIFLFGCLKKSLNCLKKKRTIEPTIILCTGSLDRVLEKSFPYLYADHFSVYNKLGIKNKVREEITKRQSKYLLSNRLSIGTIKKVIYSIKQLFDEIKNENLTESDHSEIDKLLETNIGMGWAFGTFFWEEAIYICAKKNIALNFRKEFIKQIEDKIDKLDLSKEFLLFLNNSNFFLLAHSNTAKITEESPYEGKTVSELYQSEVNEILVELERQMDKQVFAKNPSVKGLEELIKKTQQFYSKNNRIDEDEPHPLELFSTVKNEWKFDFDGLISIIENVIFEKDSPYSKKLDFHLPASDNYSFLCALPSVSINNPEKNILYYLINTIFSSICKYAYKANSPKQDGRVDIRIKDDFDKEKVIIEIEDFGKGFDIKLIRDENFFADTSHDLREEINNVKYWVDIELHTNNGQETYVVNPHNNETRNISLKKSKGTLWRLFISRVIGAYK